jgi:hypothetical protein
MTKPEPDAYWDHLEQTLRRVFSRDDAAELVVEYRRSAETLGAPEHTGLFHVDPLQIAADLGGAYGRPLTAKERSRYLKLQREWYPAADPQGPATGSQLDAIQFTR